VLRWPKIIWFHLPAATWGAPVEFTGWICPLTPLEVWLRLKGGDSGYGADFIEQYVLPVLYPAGLTHDVHVALGSFVVAANVVVYCGSGDAGSRLRVFCPNSDLWALVGTAPRK
jgi:hypothetical protein